MAMTDRSKRDQDREPRPQRLGADGHDALAKEPPDSAEPPAFGLFGPLGGLPGRPRPVSGSQQ